MKNIRTILFSCFALMAGSFASCTQEEFQPGPEVDGAQVYFDDTTPTEYDLEEDVTSLSIPVRRISTEGELTVNILPDFSQLSAESDQTLFSVPSSVTFADGEDETALVISFSRGDMVDGTDYTVGFLLNDEENSTPYGYNTFYVTLTPWPWELLGTGKFRDDWLSAMWSPAPVVEIDVQIYRHKSQEGIYMLEEPYGWPFITEFFGATQEYITEQYGISYTPANVTINCSDPQHVIFDGLVDTGISDSSYGAYLIGSVADGTLEDGIITFPTNGLLFRCDGGQLQANANGLFRIVLPGYEARDYSLTAQYAGMRVASDNETSTAVFDFTYGADVTGISYVFAEGDVTATAGEFAQAIADGTAENVYTVENFVQGAGTVSVEAELPVGSYTIIAVPSDASGAPLADEMSAYDFYFPGMGGAIPECDLALNLYKVSEYPDAAEYADECPDYSSMVYEITGSEFKSVRGFIANAGQVESALAQGTTLEQLLDGNADDWSEHAVPSINETGKYWDIYINLPANTELALVVGAENIYGKTSAVMETFTTDQLPYDGEFVIGDYNMSSTLEQDGETYNFSTVLTVNPTLDSDTEFTVENLCDGDGVTWNAVYDPEAATLTLDGTSTSFGAQNEHTNLFGQWLGITQTVALCYYSFTDPDAEATDTPMVFSVGQDNQLDGLQTYIEIGIGSLSGTSVSVLGLNSLYYPDNTTVEYVPEGGQESLSMERASEAAVPYLEATFSSARGIAAYFTPLYTGYRTYGVQHATVSDGPRTLSVSTGVCEPLPERPVTVRTVTKVPFRTVR